MLISRDWGRNTLQIRRAFARMICPQVKSAPGPVRSSQQCNTTDGSVVLGDNAVVDTDCNCDALKGTP